MTIKNDAEAIVQSCTINILQIQIPCDPIWPHKQQTSCVVSFCID